MKTSPIRLNIHLNCVRPLVGQYVGDCHTPRPSGAHMDTVTLEDDFQRLKILNMQTSTQQLHFSEGRTRTSSVRTAIMGSWDG